jgi:hypothetical protein
VFQVGATAGGRLASRLVGPAGAQVPAPVRRRWLTFALLLVAVAAGAALGLPVDGGGARRYVVIGLLAAAMGHQSATVRRVAAVGLMATGALAGALLLRDGGVARTSSRVRRCVAVSWQARVRRC